MRHMGLLLFTLFAIASVSGCENDALVTEDVPSDVLNAEDSGTSGGFTDSAPAPDVTAQPRAA